LPVSFLVVSKYEIYLNTLLPEKTEPAFLKTFSFKCITTN
jgi:hypothetical protein